MKVFLSNRALADLVEIGDYIAADNPVRAMSFVEELREKAGHLADMPLAFPLVSHLARQGIRRRPFLDYVILYRIRDQRVEILHVVHASRDYEANMSASGAEEN